MKKAFRSVLPILLLSLASNVVSAHERIVLQRGDFQKDREFIERYVIGKYGGYRELKAGKVDPSRLYIGRYDLNGDGVEELLVRISYGFVCGTVGCETVIFEKTFVGWRELSILYVSHVGSVRQIYLNVTEESSTNYKTIYSENDGLRWNGKKYVVFCLRNCSEG
ncbi:MAG: hypothetical protein IID53_16195 [Proteobacteria bacterium]|nr:hypothetical protein [Pseudomonadota bacterium]